MGDPMSKLMIQFRFILCFVFVIFSAGSFANESKPVLYFIEPVDGAVVEGDVKVVFGLKGLGVAPAGINNPKTGHHHLLIDTTDLPDMSLPLPATDKIKHFGGGQTETVISLSPGTHTLQLLLGNYAHIPHAEPVISNRITITVK